ncbi:MAG: phosphotransferase [Acidobacteria bacterium]|nr:phosphotransferase [Acidobacteriota bacterium]
MENVAAGFVLDAGAVGTIAERMQTLGWQPGGRLVSAERVGDGNMNMTVRVRTADSSFILKQARPWVVKYPQIPAPVERAGVEATFYEAVGARAEVSRRMPRLWGFDEESHLLWMEDMGEGGDLTPLYRTGEFTVEECAELTRYLVELHRVKVTAVEASVFQNRAMRALNHEHQYDFPLRAENGLDLERITPGLAREAERLQRDTIYRERVAELGRLYLADGTVLVHGDYFPGSWLRGEGGIAVIDPEFCFLGAAEYDLGVFLAHLELMGAGCHGGRVREAYGDGLDWRLAWAFAGAELMRRLIGVAQLPLAAGLAAKRGWLELSREWVCAV